MASATASALAAPSVPADRGEGGAEGEAAVGETAAVGIDGGKAPVRVNAFVRSTMAGQGVRKFIDQACLRRRRWCMVGVIGGWWV